MNRFYRTTLLLCVLFSYTIKEVNAQDVEVDKKTHIVKVDGKDAFYLTPKNKGMLGASDFALENLEHKELAYIKHEVTQRGNGNSDLTFFMVFTASGNGCRLYKFSVFNVLKPLAKIIAGANLVQNGAISEAEERKFIVLNHGFFLSESNNTKNDKIVLNTQQPVQAANIPPADIMLKDFKVYNHSELVGMYKVAKDETNTIVSVYNNMDALVCKATHPTDNDEADWSINLDTKNVTLLYNREMPLEKLFKYLIEKGYL